MEATQSLPRGFRWAIRRTHTKTVTKTQVDLTVVMGMTLTPMGNSEHPRNKQAME